MTVFAVEPDCTLSRIDGLHASLMVFLSDIDGDRLTLDLSALKDADVSFVQLMVAARRTAEKRELAVDFVSSPVADALFADAGLPGWLQTPDL